MSDSLRQEFDALKAVNILILGDVMLDRYVIGDVERISPEAPVGVLRADEYQVRPVKTSLLVTDPDRMTTRKERFIGRLQPSCGCRLRLKARWESEDCPLGKWPLLPDHQSG